MRIERFKGVLLPTLMIASITALAITLLSPSLAGSPIVTVFSDEFNTPMLDNKWTVVDPAGSSSFNLTVNPGYLRISTTSPPWRDLFGVINLYAPRIIQPINGDFVVETKVMANMDQNDEGAGIVIWKDSNNFLRLERMSRTVGYPVEQQIVFIGTIGGSWSMYDPQHSSPGGIIHLPSNIDPTYLKIARTGNVFSGYYSADGNSWNHIADIVLSVSDPIEVGLAVINVYHDGVFSADFDYFRVTTPATVDINVNPDTLNLRSKGKWITCYIELPAGYSVENIDVSTVMLIVDNENVPAEPWPTGIGDHDDDNIADLMVKFSRSAVQAIVSVGEVELTVIGEVDGIPFEGRDNIRVINTPS